MTPALTITTLLCTLVALQPPATQPASPKGGSFALDPLTLHPSLVDRRGDSSEVVAHARAVAHGQAPATQPATQPAMQFEQYQLVILRAGDNPPQIEREQAMEIQRAHLAHMKGLADQGKLVIAGPFSDQADRTMRGMCLYRVGSIDEARRLAEDDPAVKAGRLKVEVLTWNVEKGYMTFPKAPPRE